MSGTIKKEESNNCNFFNYKGAAVIFDQSIKAEKESISESSKRSDSDRTRIEEEIKY